MAQKWQIWPQQSNLTTFTSPSTWATELKSTTMSLLQTQTKEATTLLRKMQLLKELFMTETIQTYTWVKTQTWLKGTRPFLEASGYLISPHQVQLPTLLPWATATWPCSLKTARSMFGSPWFRALIVFHSFKFSSLVRLFRDYILSQYQPDRHCCFDNRNNGGLLLLDN